MLPTWKELAEMRKEHGVAAKAPGTYHELSQDKKPARSPGRIRVSGQVGIRPDWRPVRFILVPRIVQPGSGRRIGMGIADRRQREKEQRRAAIIGAAERLFFSRNYEEVSMEMIAREVELNKATIYLYFENKETLFATIVLRGISILGEMFQECMGKQVPGIVRVALMGQAYYRFSKDYPDYLRAIHFYGSERFSRENPCTAGIGKGYGSCRLILRDAIREGIGDGTIRADLDPFLGSMYLMISFMGILSMEDKWKLVIEAEGYSYEQFTGEFFRFIIPAISSGEGTRRMDVRGFEQYGFFLTDQVAGKKKGERS